MKYKVGQEVKIIATEEQLREIFLSSGFIGKIGIITKINAIAAWPIIIKDGINNSFMCRESDIEWTDREKIRQAKDGEMVVIDDINNILHPICPLNMYFEGDEDKRNVANCDFETETRSCTETCKIDKTKQTNPKDALGIQKVGLHCVPMQPLLETGLAMTEGARKYGAHNYRKDGVRFSVYFDAALRHIISWWEGEDIDPDSGIHHLIKAIACLFVVRDSMLVGNCVDDRPLRYPNGLQIEKLNKISADLIKKYPKCKEPFTWKDK